MKFKLLPSYPLFFIFSGMMMCSLALYSQNIFESKSALVSFSSKAPHENISAATTSLKGLLNTADNNFAFSIDVNSFKGFNSDLQREHFNENYLESDVYPKASFSGKLIDKFDVSLTTQKIRSKGSLDIHGVKKERIIEVTIVKTGESYLVSTSFIIPLTDHGIKIPKIVNQKIAESIDVVVKSEMVKRQ
ncbi:MAG: YceI family protein [Flavobacteriales bacterium]|nr:YceI family protein [Flavobacteriales bacterium]